MSRGVKGRSLELRLGLGIHSAIEVCAFADVLQSAHPLLCLVPPFFPQPSCFQSVPIMRLFLVFALFIAAALCLSVGAAANSGSMNAHGTTQRAKSNRDAPMGCFPRDWDASDL